MRTKSTAAPMTLTRTTPCQLRKNADVLERMGRLNEASEQYLMVAEIYFGQHDFEKAIANWERATEINPGLIIKILQKLAIAYERTGQREKAIDIYLKLAFHLQKNGKERNRAQGLAARCAPELQTSSLAQRDDRRSQ